MNRFLRLILVNAFLFFLPAALLAAPSGKVIIFHAGSLTVPFAKIEKNFEAIHPDIDIQREAGGSTKMARMISELGKPADIMASADYAVIDKGLVPAHADWNIRFATNRLVLCYTENSQYAGEITGANWHEILQRKNVVWGHSDPNLDPCGYRSVMALKLAETHYGQKGLYDSLIANRPKKNIRPKSVELISLLNTGNMDYAFEYLSVAVQHGLNYVELPATVNLGDYRYDDTYKTAEVKVTGKKPGTFITRKGKSCTYGITLVKDAPNKEAAVLFLDYLLDPEKGLKVLKEMGQPPFVPCRVPSDAALSKLPADLKKRVEVNM
ncbi:tungstate ABC transporter substrate-binding protein WtpA [Desulfoluna spongiiphila]|uniref:Tungstate/molybdate binding protein n=1 Tax=Desulfoluna spongiiphila TaxID=419481 RepID=A0A1G5GB38_9BACT|nr:tungstate ABC transporter substrate-binding protein WtpA [Desulfoluna spongiiphila]SCY47958.1 tungstate/molybdate binding protein [Desulfoluna spongiiphila]VVS93708.1 bacterial extracellular solute-binding protein [Desulfoluna spongiiphila]